MEEFQSLEKGSLSDLSMNPKHGNQFPNLSEGSNETQLWHKRFGHVSYNDLKHSLSKDINEVDENCETFCPAETAKNPVMERKENETSKAHQRVVRHVVGPITPSNKDGYKDFVTLITQKSSTTKFWKRMSLKAVRLIYTII